MNDEKWNLKGEGCRQYIFTLISHPSSFFIPHLSSLASHPFNSRFGQARPLLPISFVRL